MESGPRRGDASAFGILGIPMMHGCYTLLVPLGVEITIIATCGTFLGFAYCATVRRLVSERTAIA